MKLKTKKLLKDMRRDHIKGLDSYKQMLVMLRLSSIKFYIDKTTRCIYLKRGYCWWNPLLYIAVLATGVFMIAWHIVEFAIENISDVPNWFKQKAVKVGTLKDDWGEI